MTRSPAPQRLSPSRHESRLVPLVSDLFDGLGFTGSAQWVAQLPPREAQRGFSPRRTPLWEADVWGEWRGFARRGGLRRRETKPKVLGPTRKRLVCSVRTRVSWWRGLVRGGVEVGGLPVRRPLRPALAGGLLRPVSDLFDGPGSTGGVHGGSDSCCRMGRLRVSPPVGLRFGRVTFGGSAEALRGEGGCGGAI